MKLTLVEEIITDLNISQQLKAKGYPQYTLYAWQLVNPKPTHIAFKDYGTEVNLKRMIKPSSKDFYGNDYWEHEWIAAYTAEELSKLLPEKVFTYYEIKDGKKVFFCTDLEHEGSVSGDRLVDVMAVKLLNL